MNSVEIKKFYKKNGYVVIRDFFSGDELNELVSQTERFIKTVIPVIPSEEVYYENKEDLSTLKQVQRLSEYDSYFEKLGRSKKIIELTELVLGGKALLKNIQYFNKIPKLGKETPAHQDGYYFMIKPQEATTMWLSLGDADAENGAVWYIPETHNKGMRAHGRTSVLGFSQSITDWSDEDTKVEVQMEARAGDILVHHSLTIHRANSNQSNRHRRSIGFIFYRDDVVVDEDAHAEYKRKLNQGLKETRKI